MMEDKTTYGSIETTDSEKRTYAKKSHETNSKNKIFTQLFTTEMKEFQKNLQKEVFQKEEMVTLEVESNNTTNWLIQFLLLLLGCFVVLYISL
jgi:CRISPR/Cas system CMR subunit Cmr6 (Cas7 group RAMP superfamily)